ncbi:unnamed protein product [Paramecium octaurelia]|uniref:Uncharacterized protein n=1 Tax=Paramecium octaurelia TaxID=43137 RepID=A0A8S1WRG1_PAROT|nr:unnamed protein product [Paramecium octaurelia]
MIIIDIMKERVSDIQNIYNNTMAIKQIKYREKLRQIQETDLMSSLYQFRKLTQQDLAQFQEGAKQIFKIIAPGFDVHDNISQDTIQQHNSHFHQQSVHRVVQAFWFQLKK